MMAAKDQSVFRPAAVIAIVWFVLIYSGAVLLGIAARVGFADMEEIAADPERILPFLALQFLPGVIAGVVVASIMAAICSTADSTLLSAATTVARDMRAAISPGTVAPSGGDSQASRKAELLAMRVIIVILACFATLLALSDDTGQVFGLVLYAWVGLGASLGPVTLYCALIRKPRPIPALGGLIVGGSLAVLLHGHPLDLLIGFAAGLLTIVVAHVAAASADMSRKP